MYVLEVDDASHVATKADNKLGRAYRSRQTGEHGRVTHWQRYCRVALPAAAAGSQPT